MFRPITGKSNYLICQNYSLFYFDSLGPAAALSGAASATYRRNELRTSALNSAISLLISLFAGNICGRAVRSRLRPPPSIFITLSESAI